MKKFRADLHVHTVLSPCAEVEMIPPLIVQEALERNINIIAITDHNASANVPAVQKAALGSSLKVLAGMEVQSREDVHLLCLFENYETLAIWQSAVDASLPDMQNKVESRIYKRPINKELIVEVSENMLNYFSGRGISDKTINEMKVSERSEWMPRVGAERNCICFNYFRDE